MQMDVHQIAAMSDTSPSAKALPWWWSQTPGHKFARQGAFAFAWLRAHPQNGHDDLLSVVMSDD